MQSIHFTFSFFSSFHFNTQWGDKSEGRGRVYQKVREARVNLIYDHSFWAAHYFHEIVSILSEQRVIAHLACVMSWLESVFVLLVWKETAVIGVNLRHMDMIRWLVVRYILHIAVWEKEREIFEETLSSLALIKWEIDHLSTWLSMDKTPMICPTVLYVTGMQMQPSRSSRWKSQLWPDHRAVPVSTVVTCWNFRDDVYYTEVTYLIMDVDELSDTYLLTLRRPVHVPISSSSTCRQHSRVSPINILTLRVRWKKEKKFSDGTLILCSYILNASFSDIKRAIVTIKTLARSWCRL